MAKVFKVKASADQGIHCFDFTKDDILRSEILKFIVEKIEKANLPEPRPKATKKRRSPQNIV